MLKMFKGCEVPDENKLNSEYELLGESWINANIDADKLQALLLDFVKLHKGSPVYFMLELPPEYNSQQQVSYGQNDIGEDNERYYIDDISLEQAEELLAKYGQVLIHDGVSRFGFGGTYAMDELVVDKYNVINIMAQMGVEPYEKLLESYGLQKVEAMNTAWDTFSEEEPGVAMRYEENDVSVFDLPALLAPMGMYLHTIRPDE